MEGVVVEVRVRAPCKRFAIKDNDICHRSAPGFDADSAKSHSFFFLRTMRVVTGKRANLIMSCFWIAGPTSTGFNSAADVSITSVVRAMTAAGC